MDGGDAARDSGAAKATAVLRSRSAGLQFPGGRIHRHLKTRTTCHGRAGAAAAVYTAAIPEYLTAELAIRRDEELDCLIKAGRGVIPHIHKSLIGKKGQQKNHYRQAIVERDEDGKLEFLETSGFRERRLLVPPCSRQQGARLSTLSSAGLPLGDAPVAEEVAKGRTWALV
ncbi:histone H2A.V-like [Octodon degus]|uniref:Histone H2A n=1 Tax=Octodon degus TaxID=10160 RepID=A0A6P6EHV5_OCTDE|nr:histone H2A.V-like [Octodon degus]